MRAAGVVNPLQGRAFELQYNQPGATRWDTGAPQPVIRQLVALGAIKGDVLDSGAGPGHHAIHCAAQGYSVTGVDIAPTAVARARRNAQQAGVSVDFRLGDVTKLDGFESCFDTVIDSGCYHHFDLAVRRSYAQALRRATRPGARLFLFAFGPGRINGLSNPNPLSEGDFADVLPAGGWEITYLGTTVWQLCASAAERRHLGSEFVYVPFWEVHAARSC